jgi:hypothetical protein
MAEYYLNIQSNSGRLGTDSALQNWWGKYTEAMESSRRDPRVGPQRLGRLLADAGYKHISVNTFQLPIGGWRSGMCFPLRSFWFGGRKCADPLASRQDVDCATEPHMARLGRESVEMVSELLDSASLWLFTDRLGMSAAQLEALNNAAKMELRDTSLQLYLPM